MMNRLQTMLALAVLLATPHAGAQETVPAPVLDGIAAIVNDEVISIGEVRRTARLRRDARAVGLGSTCGQGTAPVPGTTAGAHATGGTAAPGQDELREALDCLIDSALVFREVRRFPQLAVTDADVEALMTQLEAAWGSGAALDDNLRQLGLLRSEVRTDLHRQLLTAAYIDTRFRLTVEISREDALSIWESELAPEMRERGIEVPEFESVADELVVPLLQEREVNRRVQSWINDLRTRATIERRFP
jgi:hypothetical protein